MKFSAPANIFFSTPAQRKGVLPFNVSACTRALDPPHLAFSGKGPQQLSLLHLPAPSLPLGQILHPSLKKKPSLSLYELKARFSQG